MIARIREARQRREKPERPAPNYKAGYTEYGILRMTRPSVSLATYSRFFINAGTPDNPHIIVKTGSEFFPGGADLLQAIQDKPQTIFNLRDRKRELKVNPIVRCGPAVQKPRSEDYVPSRNGRERELDSYLFVTYLDGKEEVLSKSELIALGPSRFAKREMRIALEEFAERQEEFEELKDWGLNPDTLQPLTEREREQYPWLVRLGPVPRQAKGARIDEGPERKQEEEEEEDLLYKVPASKNSGQVRGGKREGKGNSK